MQNAINLEMHPDGRDVEMWNVLELMKYHFITCRIEMKDILWKTEMLEYTNIFIVFNSILHFLFIIVSDIFCLLISF